MKVQIFAALILAGCSPVEAGKIPAGAIARPPETVAKTRSEVKTSLNGLYSSVAMIGRVQSVIQRGLSERQVATDGTPVPASLFAPSDADLLTFEDEHPERFVYQLNNSASFGLRTRSGGKVAVVLVGTLDDHGDHVAIKDAKLDVIHEKTDDRQVFHVLYEKHTGDNGVPTTEWSIDFHQLSDLYRDLGGENEAVAALSGFLEVHISEKETHVTAKDFAMTSRDVSVTFEEAEIQLIHSPSPSDNVKVKGHVDQAGTRRGEFSVLRDTDSSAAEFALNIDIQ